MTSSPETNGAGGGASPPGAAASPFPCESFREAATHLRRPFSANAVRWKIQTANMVVAYVDARTVIERLNLVVPHLWSATYEPWGERVDTGLLVCHLTIDGLTRSDIGKGPKNETQKGAYSDALKRAAVHFGVGVSLYAMSRVFLQTSPNGKVDEHGVPTLRKKDRGVELTPECERWLRDKYSQWLASDRGMHFGEALDHGDSPDAIGDPVESPATIEQPDLETAAKRQEIEQTYAALPATKRKGTWAKGRFSARLNAEQTPEQLDELASEIRELAAA